MKLFLAAIFLFSQLSMANNYTWDPGCIENLSKNSPVGDSWFLKDKKLLSSIDDQIKQTREKWAYDGYLRNKPEGKTPEYKKSVEDFEKLQAAINDYYSELKQFHRCNKDGTPFKANDKEQAIFYCKVTSVGVVQITEKAFEERVLGTLSITKLLTKTVYSSEQTAKLLQDGQKLLTSKNPPSVTLLPQTSALREAYMESFVDLSKDLKPDTYTKIKESCPQKIVSLLETQKQKKEIFYSQPPQQRMRPGRSRNR